MRGGLDPTTSVNHQEFTQLFLADFEVLQRKSSISPILVNLGQFKQDLLLVHDRRWLSGLLRNFALASFTLV